jgi:hypothetical protein
LPFCMISCAPFKSGEFALDYVGYVSPIIRLLKGFSFES